MIFTTNKKKNFGPVGSYSVCRADCFNALRRARGLHCKLIDHRQKAQTENGNTVSCAHV